MIKNYFFVAIRNFIRHKLYSFIAVAGLAFGLACAILIGLYVQEELSFDAWLSDSQRIFRVDIVMHPQGLEPVNLGGSPIPLGESMAAELPGIAAQTHFTNQSYTVEVNHQRYWEWGVAVGHDFFNVIRLPLVEGDPAKVFEHPDAVVITQATARKYFGDVSPIGKTLLFDGNKARIVTGIVKDLPYNTQFSGNIFIPYQPPPPDAGSNMQVERDFERTSSWIRFPASTYVRLAPGVSQSSIEAQIPQLFARHISTATLASVASVVNRPIKDFISAKVVPLRDVHLTADYHHGMKPGNSLTTVYGLIAIALLILLIAGLNFTNLATARAFLRSREVGLRKAVGARRKQLVVQFLAESVLTATLALVFALATVELLLPAYGNFLGHEVVFDYVRNWRFSMIVVAGTVVVGLLGGIYPALVLSGFSPAAAFRPTAVNPTRSAALRTALVVIQFAISIGLGIAVIVMFAQIKYARQIDLGFNHDNMVMLSLYKSGLTPSAQESLMQTLSRSPDITGVALSSKAPADEGDELSFARALGNPQKLSVQTVSISPGFAAVYGMKLIAGRMLSADRITDRNQGQGIEDGKNVVVDESTARDLGFTPQSAVGKTVEMVFARVTIAGVVRNAHFQGAQAVATPRTVYYYNPDHVNRISIRVKGGSIPDALAVIDNTWRRYAQGTPIQRWFLGDRIDQLYANAERQGIMLSAFVVIAVLISCLGLFGLAAFTAERRTKEIAIRKIFGADSGEIIRLLLRQFTIPVLLANLIAWPVAYFYLQRWLEGYAYRIDLSLIYFFAAGLSALVIAWATVIVHALHVARKKPVAALRYE
jgi:putative ABC transport system permease protein